MNSAVDTAVDLTPEQKRELLARLLQEKAGRPASLPLSFAQQRLWFLDQLEPNSPLYNLPVAVRIHGPLHRKALQNTLAALEQRHETLRTTFPAVNGEPTQVIARAPSADLPVTDLFEWPAGERESEMLRQVRQEARRPFDLASGPLFRAHLWRLAEDEHVLLLSMHHIVSDAWSLGVLFRELGALYESFAQGKPSRLSPVGLQYADYALWQRDYLQGDVLAQQLAYWKQQLAAPLPALELPVDHPRPSLRAFQGARQAVTLPATLLQDLKRLGQREGATLFMTLLAAFQTLLHRYSGQEDIIVGSPIANRNRSESEHLIGFFVNTLVFRTEVSATLSFRELLRRVREVAVGAYDHQDLPFELLVKELQPERDLSHNPIFQVMFVLQNAGMSKMELQDLSLTPLKIDNGTAKFDLTLSLFETNEGLGGAFEYNTQLFEAPTIKRLAGHFQSLLRGIVETPDQPLGRLPLLTPAEMDQSITWNRTHTGFPRGHSLTHWFEAQVSKSPAAVAVVQDERQLTYAQLNERANQLAYHLRAFGVGPEVPVCLFMERSLEMVVAILGILKAGGAYVPLDPVYPRERLGFMLEDAQAPVLVTQQSLAADLPPHSARTVCIDSDWQVIRQESAANPRGLTTDENLAYVIYTSGSTGQPKGVAVPHRAVNRLVLDTDYVRMSSREVMAQASNCSFDAATFELWGALLHGARLVILTKDVMLSPREFAGQMQRQGVTVLFLTTALFNQFARTMPGAFRQLRHLLFGGEAVEPRWVVEVLKHGPPERLLHVYGPTETTTFATWHEVKQVAAGAKTIPIGQPLANTTLYVLDEHRQPVPVGISGELYIGGEGVARGYLHRPELTAERFIADPFSTAPGAQLYKTGDLVRRLPDGAIEFQGRIDLQVKIRGFRIELGEIETVLGQHGAVRACAVTVRPGAEGDKRLVAYVVPQRHATPTAAELRQHLEEKLPEYMVPSAFVLLDELPLNPNGKVDRHALPEPDPARPELEKGYLAPRNAVEKQLAALWEEVLGVKPIGVRDKFFALGGHSLLAVRLCAKIEQTFGTRIPVARIFQAPTIEQLAAALKDEGWSPPGSLLVELQRSGSKPPIYWIHGVGGGMLWGYTNLARYLGPDQPVYVLKSRGMDGLEEFATIEEIAAHYVEEIRAFQPQGPYYLGGYCFGGLVAYEMARQLEAHGQRVGLLALLNCTPPNSNYYQVRWTPGLALKLLENLGCWFRDFLRWTPAQKIGFFRRKGRWLRKQLSRQWRGGTRLPPEIEGEDFADLSRYLEYRRRLWDVHIRALLNYVPQPYDGRVTLFRTRGHPLLCSYDPSYGWNELAARGTRVKIVPGDHETILEEPHVQTLARELRFLLHMSHNNLVEASQS